MEVRYYFLEFRKKIEDLKLSYNVARIAEDVQRTQEMYDLIYEFALGHYRFMLEFRKNLLETAEKQEDPKIKKKLSDLEQCLGATSGMFAEGSDEFILELAGIDPEELRGE